MLWRWAVLLLAVLCAATEVASTQEIVRKPMSLVYFSAPDCRFCQAFNDDFDYLCKLYSHYEQFQLVKVNGRKHKDLAQLFQVASFPTLKFYDDTKKSVSTYTAKRSVEGIVEFIETYSGLKPDFSAVPQAVSVVDSQKDVEEALSQKKAVLIAFVNELNDDWTTHHYAHHFYQKMARIHSEMGFLIKFVEQGSSSLTQRYHVSNFPSLVYVDRSRIGVYNTLSTNKFVKHRLPEESIGEFLSSAANEGTGHWFSSIEDLAQFANNQEYDGHKQVKGGFNLRESQAVDMDLEAQYNALVSQISM